jgi:glycosyltransferase involved in cell wall biosynthesis
MEQLKELNSSCGTDCVEFLGRKTQQEVMKHMAGAEFVVLPSLWYEGFPMTIVEAFSCGTPVIVPSIGGMKYIVDDGVNGLKFNAGDISSLVRKLEWVVQNGDKRHAMKENVKKEFKEKYSDRINCNRLLEIYREAIQQQQRVEYDDKLG